MDLSRFEKAIRFFSRRYAPNVSSISDFEEVGKTAAWEYLNRNGHAAPSDVRLDIQKKMLQHLRNLREKRASSRIVSLEQSLLSGEGDFNLRQATDTDSLINMLKKRYGEYYIQGLRNEKQPIRVVREIIRTCIENIAKIPPDRIPEEVDYNFFMKMKLPGILWTYYHNSPVKAVMDSYPGVYVPWNFKRTGRTFWKGKEGWENSLLALRWFANKRNIHDPEDCRRIGVRDFQEEGLGALINLNFNGSPYLALRTIIRELKPWQANRTPKYFFDNPENRKNALIEYLIMEGVGNISQMTTEEIFDTRFKFVVSKQSLSDAGLRELIAQYNGGTYRMFSDIFPGKVFPWFLKGAKEPWKEKPLEVAADAVRWLFEDYLDIPLNEIPDYATCSLFWKVGFSGIMTNRNINFNSSPYRAINNAYPGIFSEEQFDRHRETKTIL